MVPHSKHCGNSFAPKFVTSKIEATMAMVRLFHLASWLHRLSSHQGYWSAGTRLADSAKVAGEGIDPGDLPEYMVRRSNMLSLTSTFHLSYFSVGELKHALVHQRRVVGVLAGVAMLCLRTIRAAKPRKGEKPGVELLRSMPSRAKACP